MDNKNIMRRKSYTAIFKLEVVDFAKEKGNREAARKFNVGETSVREWRKEEAVIKCLPQKKRVINDTLRFMLYSCICDMKYL
jgi:transposase-like protein